MKPVVRWVETGGRTVLHIGRRRWMAQPVSTRRILRELTGYAGATADVQWAKLRRLLRLAFPRRISMWWLGDPVRMTEELPFTAQYEVIRRFVASLGVKGPLPQIPIRATTKNSASGRGGHAEPTGGSR